MSSAIRKVMFYTASPVETCDRCGTGIKYVSLVTYADGETQKYGSECIKKILDNAPTLKTLYNKNAKLLKLYMDALAVLSRDPKDMPRGREYFNSGKYFIADDNGNDIFADRHWFFHPLFDVEKNQSGNAYVTKDADQYYAQAMAEIEGKRGKVWLQAEITRLEKFLGSVLQKASVQKVHMPTFNTGYSQVQLQEHMPFVYDDGGRKEAGRKGYTGDCVCRAVAIATQKPYVLQVGIDKATEDRLIKAEYKRATKNNSCVFAVCII